MKRLLLIFVALLGTQCKATDSPSTAFWSWFQQNDAAYYALQPDNIAEREKLFDELSNQLGKVNADLTFEFGPVKNGKRDFVISAGGIREAFPAVQELVARAPTLAHWRVIAFRPRRLPVNTIQFQSVSLDPAKVYVQLLRDRD